jgi:beta propeller repeat protein
MRRNRYDILLPVSLLLACSTVTAAGAIRWQQFPILPGTDRQESPDVHGTIVVWHQFVRQFGDYDVYVADINNPADPKVLVIGDANDQLNPAIYDHTVAWQDYVVVGSYADWDIRMADLSDWANPQTFAVSNLANSDELSPAVQGDTVLWHSGPAGDHDINGAAVTDSSNPVLFRVTDYQFEQQNVAAYRTTVVWQDNYYGDWDIYAADIWRKNKPVEFPVSLFQADQTNPAIFGNIVVWQDNFYGDWDIYATDISDTENPVEIAVCTNQASQENPDISDNIIVWQDDRNGNWDIFGYNLTTGREFQITDNRADQTNPAIAGNTVVWQDKRSGTWNIYAAVLDGPEPAKCAAKLPADTNNDCRIDFTDYAAMASAWLDCGLAPAQACGP